MDVNSVQWRALNACADYHENLEQIYRSISLRFSSENYRPTDPNAFYWPQGEDAVPLSENVEAIRELVEPGLLSVHLPDGELHTPTSADLSYLWRG